MVGRLEKRRVATESGRDETGGPGNETGGPGNETGGSGDETGDKTAARAGDERDGGDRWVMYADEGPYAIDVCHVEEMVGTTREAADGDRVRRG